MWYVAADQKQSPDFYLCLEGAHPDQPNWITFTGDRGELRLTKAREVPGPVLSALDISRRHRFAAVLTDETSATCWSTHTLGAAQIRLFARINRRVNLTFNETSLQHWTNLMNHESVSEILGLLAIYEFGLFHLKEAADLGIDRRSIFVVHGHDVRAFDEILGRLKAHKLKPITWEDAKGYTGKATPSNLETVQAAMEHTYAIVVLMTGDDAGRVRRVRGGRRPSEAYAPQPRQNVLIEAGMAMALIPSRAILVHFDSIRGPSDFAGLNVVEYDYTAAARERLAAALTRAGCLEPA